MSIQAQKEINISRVRDITISRETISHFGKGLIKIKPINKDIWTDKEGNMYNGIIVIFEDKNGESILIEEGKNTRVRVTRILKDGIIEVVNKKGIKSLLKIEEEKNGIFANKIIDASELNNEFIINKERGYIEGKVEVQCEDGEKSIITQLYDLRGNKILDLSEQVARVVKWDEKERIYKDINGCLKKQVYINNEWINIVNYESQTFKIDTVNGYDVLYDKWGNITGIYCFQDEKLEALPIPQNARRLVGISKEKVELEDEFGNRHIQQIINDEWKTVINFEENVTGIVNLHSNVYKLKSNNIFSVYEIIEGNKQYLFGDFISGIENIDGDNNGKRKMCEQLCKIANAFEEVCNVTFEDKEMKVNFNTPRDVLDKMTEKVKILLGELFMDSQNRENEKSC